MTSVTLMQRTKAILRLRCPVCLKGGVFRSIWRMHEACPKCEISFEREPGFFSGALYFSYGIGILLAAPLAIFLFLRGVDEMVIYGAVIAELAIISPLLYRYSRVVWMHFDQRIDPR